MILSQFLEATVAEAERRAISHPPDVEAARDAEQKDDRRPHFAKLGVHFAQRHDLDIGVAQGFVDRLADASPELSCSKSTSFSRSSATYLTAISLALSPAACPPMPSQTMKKRPLGSAKPRSSLFSR